MQTRSQGSQNLQPLNNNIYQFQREIRGERNRLLAEQREQVRMENQQAHHPVNAPQQRPPRPIGAGDAPNTYNNRHGIVPPPISNNNFEIKSSTINMVQNQKFHGLPVENPLDHLDAFERLCGLTKINGVSEDAFKLRLFPFSLGDKAQQWEKHLPQGSITTWEDCKKAFLAKFFSTSRTAKFRNQISSFVQHNSESFSEAWERFRIYQSQCPHHGFSDESLLSILYRGVLPKIRMLLDTASNGNFLNKEVEDGWELVENMAAADGNYGEEYDRTPRGRIDSDFISKKEMNTLNERLDKLNAVDEKLDKLLSVQSRKSVHMVSDDERVLGEEEDQFEEISYMQNQGNYSRNQGNYLQNQNNFKQHQGNYNAYKPNPNPNLSYRNNNVANPQDQIYPPQQQQPQPPPYVPRQPFNNNYKAAQTTPPGYQRPQAPPPPQAPQPPAQTPDIMNMLQQLLQGQASSAQMNVDLHNKIDSSHKELNSKIEQLNSRMNYLESQQASSSVKTSGQLPGKSIQNPKEYNVNAITLISSHNFDDVVMDDTITEDSNVEEGEATLSTLQLTCQSKADISVEVPVHSTLEEEPTRPSGGRAMPTLAEIVVPPEHSRSECLDKSNNPPIKPLQVLGVQSDLAKLDDPGALTLPCSIGRTFFPRCICDSGAAVCVMPFSVANRLGLRDYKSCDYSLLLADRTLRAPVGLLENVPLQIGGVVVPTDFAVMHIADEPKDPILLGRPFLASTRALIDMASGTIELSLGERDRVKFLLNGAETTPPTQPPDRQSETPLSITTPTILLEPTAYRDGAIEYTVKNGRRPTPLELIRHLRPHQRITTKSLGPFGVQEVKPSGSISLAVAENATLPFTGQKVKLYLVESERTPPPLPKPPI